MPPRTISVIIPAFNSAALVTQAVDSALAQTLPPNQIIVVDDGSTDDTRARLASYSDRIQYFHQPNRGVASARNTGLAHASGDLIAFLDADDVWHPRKLELQQAALSASPEIILLGSQTFAWPGMPLPVGGENKLSRIKWHDLAVKNRFVTSSIVAFRATIERAGGFDSALQGPEDHDLWLRIAEEGAVANLEQPLTGYRDIAGSLSRQAPIMRAGMRRILAKLDDRNAWRGRSVLRRRAYGYCEYSCAYMSGAAGMPATALGELARSLLWYPLPYGRAEVRFPLARLRMLPMNLARMLRLRRN